MMGVIFFKENYDERPTIMHAESRGADKILKAHNLALY
jgi:hypothetical protein